MLAAKQHLDPIAPRDLDASIPEDLASLATALLQRDPSRRPGEREVLQRLSGTTAPPEIVSLEPRALSAFVGREVELGELRQALTTVTMGQPVTMLVHGESGQGKSALVREFLERIAHKELPRGKPLVLAGRCWERESVPYKAVDEIVDQLSRALADMPHEHALELLPDDAALLPDVFPVLARVPAIANATPRSDELDPQVRRLRTFAALRDLLARLAAVNTADDRLRATRIEAPARIAAMLTP